MNLIQVDPEVPDSVRMSLEDSNPRKNQEADGSENSDNSESPVSKRPSFRCQDSLNRLARPNLARPPSRPGSANGHVPSIIMLTSVDHSDATKYGFNLLLSVGFCLA